VRFPESQDADPEYLAPCVLVLDIQTYWNDSGISLLGRARTQVVAAELIISKRICLSCIPTFDNIRGNQGPYLNHYNNRKRYESIDYLSLVYAIPVLGYQSGSSLSHVFYTITRLKHSMHLWDILCTSAAMPYQSIVTWQVITSETSE
jgi:hypothetical protein